MDQIFLDKRGRLNLNFRLLNPFWLNHAAIDTCSHFKSPQHFPWNVFSISSNYLRICSDALFSRVQSVAVNYTLLLYVHDISLFMT